MSSAHIPAELRKLVANRADRLCEYCLLHEDDTYLGCQVDHIARCRSWAEGPDSVDVAICGTPIRGGAKERSDEVIDVASSKSAYHVIVIPGFGFAFDWGV